MSLRCLVCPPAFWQAGFVVSYGYPLANTFFTRCYFMQLKRYASGLSWFVVQFIKQDFFLQMCIQIRYMFLIVPNAVTSPLAPTGCLWSNCYLLYVLQLHICTQASIISNSNGTLATCIVFAFCIVSLFCPIRAGLRFASQGMQFLISLLRKRF